LPLDERLEKLAERHEALAQSVELLTADVRGLAAQQQQLAAQYQQLAAEHVQMVVEQRQMIAKSRERDQRVGTMLERVMDGWRACCTSPKSTSSRSNGWKARTETAHGNELAQTS